MNKLFDSDSLKKNLAAGLKKQLFFNHPALNVDGQDDLPEHLRSNPDNFFQDVAHFIDLEDLYKIIDTCYYNDEMNFCPVLLRVGQERMIEAYDGHPYLLQVWDMDKNKVYERTLKEPIKLWSISNDVLLYVIVEDDVEYLYTIDLNQPSSVNKISNFSLGDSQPVKYLSYINDKIYIASSEKIRVLNRSQYELQNQPRQDIDANDIQACTIEPGLSIHGFVLDKRAKQGYYQIVAIETPDNQLDFNKLIVKEEDGAFTHSWEQMREVVPRKTIPHDPIVKNIFTVSGDVQYGISLRSSGKFDIYTDFTRRDSPMSKYCIDIEMVNDKFYFKMIDGNMLSFSTKDYKSASFELASKVNLSIFKWEKLLIKKVQNIVNLYKGIQMNDYKGVACCFIPHGKFLSLFDATNWTWLRHFVFDADVLKTYRSYYSGEWVVLTSGHCHVNWQFYEGADEVGSRGRHYYIPGKIIRTNEDVESYQGFYMTVLINGEYQLYCNYKGHSKRILKEIQGKSNLNVCTLQNREATYFVLQNGTDYSLYLQEDNGNDDLKLTKIRQYNDMPEITGNLMNGTFYDYDKHMFLFDEKNMYVIRQRPFALTVFEDVNCIGLQNFQNNYNYILCQEKKGSKNSGLRFFDMESVMRSNKLNNTLLKKIDIGTCGTFEWTGHIVRICFLESLKSVVICPILHRCQSKFIGVTYDSVQIASKIQRDQYVNLSESGLLQAHSILTSKLISKHQLEDYQFENMSLFMKGRRGYSILTEDTDEDHISKESFYEPWQLETNMQNQKSFAQINMEDYKMSKFAVIEIKNEKEIIVHSVFFMPKSENMLMYFNKAHDRMLVINEKKKVTLYQSMPESQEGPSYRKKWIIVKQINDYPVELEIESTFITMITPDFSRYIIVDKKLKQFKIKDVYSDQVICTIPKHLMHFGKGEEPEHITNRFKFLDHDLFITTSICGIEKKIQIDDENVLHEIGYNQRPLFNDIDGEEWKTVKYYYQRQELSNNKSILQRLKRKYQDHKSMLFLHGVRDRTELYENLFGSDPFWAEQNEQSFTFIHWSLIDQIKKGELSVDEIEDSVLEQIYFNILPGGNTALHVLTSQPEQLMKFVQRAHPTEDSTKFHMPFLPNFNGQTPLHMLIEKKDIKTVTFLLKYLKLYEIDHHSRAIKDQFRFLIEQDIPEFLDYLDARFMQTSQLQAINRGCLKENGNSLIAKEIQFNEQIFRDQFMETGVESRIKCEFLDVGGIYHFKDQDFDGFFDTLANTENILTFERRSIQTLIEFNYDTVRQFVVKRLFVPFCIFQIVFFIHMNFIYEQYKVETTPLLTTIFLSSNLILVLFATYFLANEIKQLKNDGIEYLTSFWNYIDIVPPIGIYLIVLVVSTKEFGISLIDDAQERTILAIVTFFMWFKFLYFLRIFRNTGYLIRMIVEVVKDMRHFFLVLSITIAAFGDSMLVISLGNGVNEQGESLQFTTGFIDSLIFTYRMVLGDFDTSGFGEVATPVIMVLFLLCTVFNMIVMLNLLIAIISDSYARVTANAELTTYQERASMIGENNYLVPANVMEQYAPKDKMLLSINDLEKVSDERMDPVLQKLESLLSNVGGHTEQITTIESTVATLKEEMSAQKTLYKEDTNEIKRLLRIIMTKREEVMTKVHKHTLIKYVLKDAVTECGWANQNWSCDGINFTGCKSNYRGIQTSENEEFYHCDECCFDYCARCFDEYGQTHEHDLTKTTWAEVRQSKPDEYSDGWGCDARVYRICPNRAKYPCSDQNDVQFLDKQCNFSLCTDCAEFYKI